MNPLRTNFFGSWEELGGDGCSTPFRGAATVAPQFFSRTIIIWEFRGLGLRKEVNKDREIGGWEKKTGHGHVFLAHKYKMNKY